MNYIVLDMEWNQPIRRIKHIAEPFYFATEILEIGAVRINGDLEKIGEFKSYVKPRYYPDLNPEILSLTGIDPQDIFRAPGFRTVYKAFRDFCGDDFCFLTWGNSDIPTLLDNILIHGLSAEGFPVCYDLQRIFGCEIMESERTYSLDLAANMLHLTPAPAHDALNDARNTAAIFTAVDLHSHLDGYELYFNLYEENRRKCLIEGRKYETRDEALTDDDFSMFTCPWCKQVHRITDWRKTKSKKGTILGYAECPEGPAVLASVKVQKCRKGVLARRALAPLNADTGKAYRSKCDTYRKIELTREPKAPPEEIGDTNMANEKFTAVGTNIAEKATMIWNVADLLRGPFKPHEYGLVILPMTVVKRFHDCLLPTHDAVLATYEKIKTLAVKDGFLRKASGYQFYNTSKFTFESLIADPENIESNFRDYLGGFSSNVQDVLAKFDFETIIRRMVDSNTLYLVIREFASQKGYLGPAKISAVDCGYIFEDLVRRFSESFGEEAGAHFTSRDIIYLMTDLLVSGADMSRQENITVYDMAMGTSQMLSCMEERIHDLNPDMEVTCFGQEFNPSTFAIAKADMMIRGGNPENMRFGDTLSEDQFTDYTFRYIISNPPFGIDWKREQKAVEAEAAKGEDGRFAPGLPKISDGQQLFVLNGLKKLDSRGKMAIIQNGSPLFSGDAGSGPSNIRQYILEHDWLDCIVQLSTDMFMNTGISTYIWVLDKDKPVERTGKVQLIDASHCFTPRRKSIGTKRNDISDNDRALILRAYNAYTDGVFGDKAGDYCESKIFDNETFGYNKIVVERPLRDEQGEVVKKKNKPVPDTALRDTENVPLTEDIDAYFAREVLPYAPDAWIDKAKTKIGYEIPMTRYFYEYQKPEASEDILARIIGLENSISASLKGLFGGGDQ